MSGVNLDSSRLCRPGAEPRLPSASSTGTSGSPVTAGRHAFCGAILRLFSGLSSGALAYSSSVRWLCSRCIRRAMRSTGHWSV